MCVCVCVCVCVDIRILPCHWLECISTIGIGMHFIIKTHLYKPNTQAFPFWCLLLAGKCVATAGASGLISGRDWPRHIATCVGNTVCMGSINYFTKNVRDLSTLSKSPIY